MAERALGRLDGVTTLLPRQEQFLYMYVRKEAVLASQIEGTKSTLTDLLGFETEARAGQPVIIKTGLINVQFETIHPFLDGKWVHRPASSPKFSFTVT